MSKIGNYVLELQEQNEFSAWSADGKSEVILDGPVDPDCLVGDDVPDYKNGGSIVYLEPEEIEVILELSKTATGRQKRVLELLYERLK
tara:strand:- start:1539 stop:1802 length:264 start_codon:yes stop_codon:yes gene_type:complete